MDFVTKSFRKDETVTSWTLLQHIFPHFWAWLLNTMTIKPKSEDKYVQKVFNLTELHFSKVTSFKIGTWTFKTFLATQHKIARSKMGNLCMDFHFTKCAFLLFLLKSLIWGNLSNDYVISRSLGSMCRLK